MKPDAQSPSKQGAMIPIPQRFQELLCNFLLGVVIVPLPYCLFPHRNQQGSAQKKREESVGVRGGAARKREVGVAASGQFGGGELQKWGRKTAV